MNRFCQRLRRMIAPTALLNGFRCPCRWGHKRCRGNKHCKKKLQLLQAHILYFCVLFPAFFMRLLMPMPLF